jgi:hypothetical protein
LLNLFFGAHDTHVEDAISLALYLTTKACACVCPSGYHRYTLASSFCPTGFIDVERGIAPYIATLVTLGGRTTRDGHLKTQPLRCISTPESHARRFTLGLEL